MKAIISSAILVAVGSLYPGRQAADLPSLDPPSLPAAATRAVTGGRADDLAISGVAVVDVERGRVVRDQVVLISGGRITAVEPTRRARVPGGVRTVDGRGKYLIPGLLDMHAHLTNSGKPVEVELPLFVAHGVTGVRVMGADSPNPSPTETPGLALHRDWQARIEAGTLLGPRLLALATWVVNGPRGLQPGMPTFYRAGTREEGQQLARYFKDRGFDFIKIYNGVSREGYLGLAEEARRLGLPFAGHEPATLSAIELSNAGQRSLEHSRVFLLNCWAGADSMRRGLLKLSPTAVRRRMIDEYDPKICAEVFRTFAANRTYITPTLRTRKMDAFADQPGFRSDPRIKYIPLLSRMAWNADADRMVASDSTAEGRRAFMDFYLKGRSLTNDAFRAGVPVMVGTDAGDSFVFAGSSVHDELDELVAAGLTPAEALRAATLAGAEYLGRTGDLGSIGVGRLADLVLLDADPLADIRHVRQIRAVVANGRLLERAALDSILAGVEEVARPSPQNRLWAGAIFGDTVAIAAALEAGARIDSVDVQFTPAGRRALNYAAGGNRIPAVRLLLARGAALDLADTTGATPLMHAVEGGAVDALRILIDAGADVSRATNAGLTPLVVARRRGLATAVTLLEEAAARRPPR